MCLPRMHQKVQERNVYIPLPSAFPDLELSTVTSDMVFCAYEIEITFSAVSRFILLFYVRYFDDIIFIGRTKINATVYSTR
jgi:hypothetical protein